MEKNEINNKNDKDVVKEIVKENEVAKEVNRLDS